MQTGGLASSSVGLVVLTHEKKIRHSYLAHSPVLERVKTETQRPTFIIGELLLAQNFSETNMDAVGTIKEGD